MGISSGRGPYYCHRLDRDKGRIDQFSCGIALPEDWVPKEFSDLLKSVSEETFRIYREGCADLMAPKASKKSVAIAELIQGPLSRIDNTQQIIYACKIALAESH